METLHSMNAIKVKRHRTNQKVACIHLERGQMHGYVAYVRIIIQIFAEVTYVIVNR